MYTSCFVRTGVGHNTTQSPPQKRERIQQVKIQGFYYSQPVRTRRFECVLWTTKTNAAMQAATATPVKKSWRLRAFYRPVSRSASTGAGPARPDDESWREGERTDNIQDRLVILMTLIYLVWIKLFEFLYELNQRPSSVS